MIIYAHSFLALDDDQPNAVTKVEPRLTYLGVLTVEITPGTCWIRYKFRLQFLMYC